MAEDNANDNLPEKQFQISKSLSRILNQQTRNLDLALAGKTYTDDQGVSTAIINQELFWDEIEGYRYRLDLGLRLSLPNLEDKYKLVISNFNDNRVRRSNYSRGSFRDDNEDEYGATFSFIKQFKKFKVAFEPRIRFSGGFGTYYNLRFENQFVLKKDITNLETRFEFFADANRGTGQFVALTFEHILSKKWAFSFIFEEEYQAAESILKLLQGLNLFYEINSRMLIANSLILRSSNRKELREESDIVKESFRLQEIALGPSFTHKLFKDEIHYSINYTYIWNREQNFSGYHSASFLLSFIF